LILFRRFYIVGLWESICEVEKVFGHADGLQQSLVVEGVVVTKVLAEQALADALHCRQLEDLLAGRPLSGRNDYKQF
jgi:hypothetical protein